MAKSPDTTKLDLNQHTDCLRTQLTKIVPALLGLQYGIVTSMHDHEFNQSGLSDKALEPATDQECEYIKQIEGLVTDYVTQQFKLDSIQEMWQRFEQYYMT